MAETEDAITTLSDEEAWEFLRRREFGRLAYRLADEVHIVPVNFAVTPGRVLFRTAEGSKLLGVTMHKEVAFEADEIGPDRATSVVVRGLAVHLKGKDAAAAAEVPLRNWVPTDKYEYVAVEVGEITGRSFVIDGPSTSG